LVNARLAEKMGPGATQVDRAGDGREATLLDDYLADPYSSGDRAAIRKQGLHYVAAHPDLKTAFIQRLVTLPFRCYVMVARIGSQGSYASANFRAFQWMFAVLCQRCDGQKLAVLVEENSKFMEPALQGVMHEYYRRLADVGLARPLTDPELSIVSKSEFTVSLPDFMLGVLAQYALGKDGIAVTQFERLRDRYSLI
jgi:hypothetical protein